jgi:hypothetical protein
MAWLLSLSLVKAVAARNTSSRSPIGDLSYCEMFHPLACNRSASTVVLIKETGRRAGKAGQPVGSRCYWHFGNILPGEDLHRLTRARIAILVPATKFSPPSFKRLIFGRR